MEKEEQQIGFRLCKHIFLHFLVIPFIWGAAVAAAEGHHNVKL